MTRQELKTKDEITSKLQAFTEIVYERRKEILISLGAFLVLAAGVLGWNMFSARRNAAASTQLSAAIMTFNDSSIATDKERYEKTIAEAQRTIDSYGSMPQAEIAKYYIAMSKQGLGDTAGAVQGLEAVISGRADAETKDIARFALAGIHRRGGEEQKAIEVLKQLRDSGGYSKSAVTFELGRAHESAGQRDEAKKYYDQVVLEFSESPFRDDAQAALKRLGFPIPAPAASPAPANP